jgi:DNA-binding MarR family transcriptional regulator
MFDSDQTSPSVLADLTGMTRGAVSKLVDRLVNKKMVSRHERSDDRRYQSIALTSAGRRLVPLVAAIADQNDEEFFRPLSASERAFLISTLKKLVQKHGLYKLPTE